MTPEQLQHRLDLLADEELSPEEQRELFAQLDNTPEGWRRCALTLLEARCWQRSLSRLVSQSQQEPAADPRRPRPLAPPANMRRLEQLAWATVAVALLVVGVAVGRWFPQPPAVPSPQPETPLAHRQATPKTLGVEQAPPALAVGGNSEARPGAPEAAEEKPASPMVASWGGFWRWQDTTAEGHPVHRLLPAPVAATMDGPALQPQDVFSRQWLRTLQMLGHQIQVRRHWLTVPAADGTEVLIPRYEIHVVPVQAAGIQ